MSEALASSSATLRPGQQRIQSRPRPAPRPIQLGTRYLGLIATWAVVIGLTFKSELLTPNQVWQLTAGLALLVTAGLLFLHIRNRTPGWLSPHHYITPVLSIVAATAFSLPTPNYRIHSLALLSKVGFNFAGCFVVFSRGVGGE